MGREPRPDGKIVEAGNFGSRMEADAAIAMLRANGIQASGKFGDSGGWLPHVALVDGFRVVVFDDELDAAKALIAAADAELDADFEPTDPASRSRVSCRRDGMLRAPGPAPRLHRRCDGGA
jgi:hypothetical protein